MSLVSSVSKWAELFFTQSLLDTTSYFTPCLVPGSSWSIGDITAISYLSPSWIYLTQSSGLLLKWFSAFRPCVPCVRLCAKGLNPLPRGLGTGWGNEEEWSYWFHFGGQGGSSRGRAGVWRANAAICYPYFVKQTRNPNNYSCCWVGNTSQNSWQKRTGGQ